MLPFKVTKKYLRGSEVVVAKCNEQEDARMLIAAKLDSDAKFKVEVIYRLYDFDELIEEFSQGKGSVERVAAVDNSSSAGVGSKQVFSPSPLSVAPRPGGLPLSSFKNENDEKK